MSLNIWQSQVGDSRVLLIDVRNRTELNEVGQIPGSVCLPLHEVEAAFRDLEAEEFKERRVEKNLEPERSFESDLM